GKIDRTCMGEAARIQAHRGPGGTLGAPMTTRPGLAAMGCALLVACGAPPAPALTSTPNTEPAIVPNDATERVRFPSRDADLTAGAPTALDAVLFRPAGTGPFATVIALHGCSGLFTSKGALHPRDRAWALHL